MFLPQEAVKNKSKIKLGQTQLPKKTSLRINKTSGQQKAVALKQRHTGTGVHDTH